MVECHGAKFSTAWRNSIDKSAHNMQTWPKSNNKMNAHKLTTLLKILNITSACDTPEGPAFTLPPLSLPEVFL